MPSEPLTGTHLRDEVAWLKSHAVPDKDKTYRCKLYGNRIRSRVLHRYRAISSGPDAPFVEEHLWATGPGVTPGTGISFLTLWCPRCDKNPRKHPSVHQSDLVCVGLVSS